MLWRLSFYKNEISADGSETLISAFNYFPGDLLFVSLYYEIPFVIFYDLR